MLKRNIMEMWTQASRMPFDRRFTEMRRVSLIAGMHGYTKDDLNVKEQ